MKKTNYRRRTKKSNKLVTKQQVKSIIKKADPASIPSFKYIFGPSFSRDTLSLRLMVDLANPIITATAGSGALPTTPSYGALSFNFLQANFSSNLGTLFDQYRIVGIDVEFEPQQNIDGAGNGNNYMGSFYTMVDTDDATVESALTAYKANPKTQITNCMKKHRHRFIPGIATAVFGGGVFTSYGNNIGQWLDCKSSSVPHYGIKYAFSGGTSTTDVASYSIEAYMHLQMRHLR